MPLKHASMAIRPRLLYAIALLLNSATGVVVVAQPLLAIGFGAGPLTLGLLGSAGALVYTLGCPLAGHLSDLNEATGGVLGAGRRRSLIMSCSLLAAVDLCIFFVRGIRDIFIMAVCGCFSAAFFWAPLQAWLAEAGGRRRLPKRLGMFNLSWSLGIMIGPLIGGYLYSMDYRYPWCYAVAANAIILALLLGGRVIPERDERMEAEREQPGYQGGPGAFLPLALWANFVCWFSLSNLQSLYPKLALARGLSPQAIGSLLFLVGAAQSACFVLLRSNSFWHFRYGPLVFVHAAAAAGMLAVFGTGSLPILSAAFPLLGLGLGLSYYSSIYYSVYAFGKTGRRASIHEFIVGSGFLLGPIAGGCIAGYAGLRFPFLLCALLLGATAVMEALIWRRMRGGPDPWNP